MDKKQITEIVNRFTSTTIKATEGPDDVKDMVVALKHGDGYWDLNAVRRPVNAKSYDLVLDFPPLPTDRTDAAIELAAFLSVRLNKYYEAKRKNLGRTAEVRRASAKKAAEARWAKYREGKAGAE